MGKFASFLRFFGGVKAFAAVAIVSAASTVQADPILFDFTGSGGPGVVVTTFDELPGNALAVNAQALIANTPVGGTTAAFDLYYQANVRLINDTSGVPITVDTGAFSFTAVAKFSETATVLGNGTVVFNLAADQSASYLNFFAHPPGGPGNDLAGTGFSNDLGGKLIYSAVPGNSGNSGNFTTIGTGVSNLDQHNTPPSTTQQTVSGAGGASITVFTTYFDSNYFRQNPGASTTFNTNNNLPFRDASPSKLFENLSAAGSSSTFLNYITPNLGAVNGLSGPDVQFQADASNSFVPFAVPEPASVAMTVMGLVGVGAFASRRRKAAQA